MLNDPFCNRHFVISRLRKLETLDYKAVTPEEREESLRIYGASLSVSSLFVWVWVSTSKVIKFICVCMCLYVMCIYMCDYDLLFIFV